MVITDQLGMNTDTLAVFCAFEVVRICTGLTAITRIFTGVDTLMGVPVVTSVVFYEYREVLQNVPSKYLSQGRGCRGNKNKIQKGTGV